MTYGKIVGVGGLGVQGETSDVGGGGHAVVGGKEGLVRGGVGGRERACKHVLCNSLMKE